MAKRTVEVGSSWRLLGIVYRVVAVSDGWIMLRESGRGHEPFVESLRGLFDKFVEVVDGQ